MDQQQLDRVFADIPEPERAPGFSVLVQRGEETLYERATGYASLEYGLPVTRQTVFHVASVSKQFTALCVTLLEEDGRIDVDASIRKWFPELPACMEPVTVRHLLHHTGGMREQWDLFTLSGSTMEDLATPGQTLRALARQTRLNFAPGERYQYCNCGFILLAQLVERVTGRTLRQFARERVFRPLGMESTYFRDDHREICYDRAESYSWNGRRYEHDVLTFDVAGNTSLNTTPRDLCRWLAELAHPAVLPPAAVARMKEPFTLNSGAVSDYCRGIRRGSFRGLEIYYHTGVNAGFRALTLLAPALDLRIAVLSNLAAAQPWQKAQRLIELLAPEALQPVDLCACALSQDCPVADGTLLHGTAAVRLSRTPGGLCWDDGTAWAYTRLRGNEYVCAQNRDRLFSQPDGTVARVAPDGACTVYTPAAFVPVPEREREKAGFYLSAELLTFYELRFEGEELILRHLKTGDRRFRRLADGRYLCAGDDTLFLTLHPGARPAFTLDTDRTQELRFEKTDAVR